jgi:hypothetical protein
MLKFRLVALCTLIALAGLVFALAAMNRRQLAQATGPTTSASAPVEPQPVASEAAPVEPAAAILVAPVSSNGVRDYSVLPDGRPVPELPATAPKTCGFGAILITYEGVQLAPRHPRSKTDALELAQRLLPEAELDFAEAVKKGDSGSLADAGSIARGVLERSVEYQLFTLEKGKVYPEPIETPRGYWILRRTR